MKANLHARRRPAWRGFILFELVLALTIFSIAVLGLVKALNMTLQTANLLRRDQLIRIGMRNVFEELRNKPLAKMSTTITDTTFGITYTSSTEALSLKTTNGGVLSDMYKLTIHATSSFDGVAQEDTLEVYVYKPAQS
ncbi:type IV pilus modification PilV family protein [Prosthecobacter fluviatilis]|uniref:Prepilin-type N-terminal cleavage/methylation domain-containing protein n=1 Tax=Prosthecobacter fluviatilis TaxID=445931 RepID=A0ABW0KL07_9BACT